MFLYIYNGDVFIGEIEILVYSFIENDYPFIRMKQSDEYKVDFLEESGFIKTSMSATDDSQKRGPLDNFNYGTGIKPANDKITFSIHRFPSGRELSYH
jgi:hypothetical protein